MRRAATFILALALIWGLAGCGGEETASPERLSPCASKLTAFSEMEYVPVTAERAEALAAEISAAAEDGGEKLPELYQAAAEELCTLKTMYNISGIHNSEHMRDEYWAERYEEDGVALSLAQDKLAIALSAAMEGENSGALLEAMTDADAYGIYGYVALDEATEELLQREAELVNAYGAAAAEDYYYPALGRQWTLEDFWTDAADELSYEEYFEILEGVLTARSHVLAPIYTDLVRVRNELARVNGCESYAEYAYGSLYGRTYYPEAVEPFCGYVREHLAPLAAEMAADERYINEPELSYESTEELLRACDEALELRMPALGDAADHILELGLYTAEPGEDGYEGCFMTDLPAYGDAYLYLSRGGGALDLTDAFHELGHYSHELYAGDFASAMDMGDLDVAEIHSTALENIMSRSFSELFDEETAENALRVHLYSSVYSVVMGCVYEEFERYAYSHPEAGVEELNQEFFRIEESYSVYDYSGGMGWCDMPHLYSSPFYCISYSVSGLAALGIQAEYDRDPAAGARTYLDVLKVDTLTDMDYRGFCAKNRLLYFGAEDDVAAAAEYVCSRMA